MQSDNNEEMFPVVDEEGNIIAPPPVANAITAANCSIR